MSARFITYRLLLYLRLPVPLGLLLESLLISLCLISSYFSSFLFKSKSARDGVNPYTANVERT